MIGHQADQLRADAMADDEIALIGITERGPVECARHIAFAPVAHVRLESAQLRRARTADSAIIVDEDRRAAFSQMARELEIKLLRDARRRIDLTDGLSFARRLKEG